MKGDTLGRIVAEACTHGYEVGGETELFGGFPIG